MVDARRPSTLGLLIGLTLGLVVGFSLGITLALAAFVPDPPPASSTSGAVVPRISQGLSSGSGNNGPTPVVTGGAGAPDASGDPVAPTLSPAERDECLRAAGIDPAGPRPTGIIGCLQNAEPNSPHAEPVPLSTAPAMTVAPTTR